MCRNILEFKFAGFVVCIQGGYPNGSYNFILMYRDYTKIFSSRRISMSRDEAVIEAKALAVELKKS